MRHSFLPWTLLALVLLAGVGGFLLEQQKQGALESRVATTTHAEERARTELTAVTEANRALDNRVQELQNELRRANARAATARIEAMTKKEKVTEKKARRRHGKRDRRA
jgi:uncharacterized protein HemX